MGEGPQDQVPEPASGQEADLEPVNETPSAPVADTHQGTASETPGEKPAKSHFLVGFFALFSDGFRIGLFCSLNGILDWDLHSL